MTDRDESDERRQISDRRQSEPIRGSALELPLPRYSRAKPARLVGAEDGTFWVWRPDSPFFAAFADRPLQLEKRIHETEMRRKREDGSGRRFQTPSDFWGRAGDYGLVRETSRIPLHFSGEDPPSVAHSEGAHAYFVDEYHDRTHLQCLDVVTEQVDRGVALDGRWKALRPQLVQDDELGYLVDDRPRLFAVELDGQPSFAWQLDLPFTAVDIDIPVHAGDERVYVVGREAGPGAVVLAVDKQQREVVDRWTFPGSPRAVAWVQGGFGLIVEDGDRHRLHVRCDPPEGVEVTDEYRLDVELRDFLEITAQGPHLAVVEAGLLHLVEAGVDPAGKPLPVRWSRTPLPEGQVEVETDEWSEPATAPYCGGATFGEGRLALVIGSTLVALEPRYRGGPDAPADFNLALGFDVLEQDPPDHPASVHLAGDQLVMLEHHDLGRIRIEPVDPSEYEKADIVYIDAYEVSDTGRVTVQRWHLANREPEGQTSETGVEVLEAKGLPAPASPAPEARESGTADGP